VSIPYHADAPFISDPFLIGLTEACYRGTITFAGSEFRLRMLFQYWKPNLLNENVRDPALNDSFVPNEALADRRSAACHSKSRARLLVGRGGNQLGHHFYYCFRIHSVLPPQVILSSDNG
jgi:hypothetical protein